MSAEVVQHVSYVGIPMHIHCMRMRVRYGGVGVSRDAWLSGLSRVRRRYELREVVIVLGERVPRLGRDVRPMLANSRCHR